MQLRKDPITESWIALGQRELLVEPAECPLDAEAVDKLPAILSYPAEGTWQVRVIAHPDPLYRIEGEPGRFAEGMYDKMGAIGAHEVVIETRQHDKPMSQFSDDEVDRVLSVWAARITDLKKDPRFKYVSIFKNQGALAGEEWSHAHSQITATIFVPRRLKYELSASHEWYKDKERCIFCDMVRQEEKLGKRIVDVQVIITPYAPTLCVSRSKLGSCTAATIIFSSNPAPVPIAAISPRCSGAFCAVSKKSPPLSTWWCTPRPTLVAKKANLRDIGRLSPTITTGTLKSCPSSKRAASLTALRKFILTPCSRKTLRKSCVPSIEFMTSPSRKIFRHPQKGGIISTLIGLLFLVLLCGALYLARVPLLRLAAESWIVDEPVDHADVIIVLSDDNFYADRVTRAAELMAKARLLSWLPAAEDCVPTRALRN